MDRPSRRAVAMATVGGLANVATVTALYARAAYPTLESTSATGLLVLTGFSLGFIVTLITAHTRLLTPTIGLFAVLSVTTFLELTTPLPVWSELHGHTVVDGATHVGSYANTWYLWLGLFVFAGVTEYGVRRGYAIGDRRLRNLPSLPLTQRTMAWTVTGSGGLLGSGTLLLVLRSGVSPTPVAVVLLLFGTTVTAVPLVALLKTGLVLPTALFALVVPYSLATEVFVTTESPVHILLFGPYTVVLALSWLLESQIRTRLLGWDGGRFVA